MNLTIPNFNDTSLIYQKPVTCDCSQFVYMNNLLPIRVFLGFWYIYMLFLLLGGLKAKFRSLKALMINAGQICFLYLWGLIGSVLHFNIFFDQQRFFWLQGTQQALVVLILIFLFKNNFQLIEETKFYKRLMKNVKENF